MKNSIYFTLKDLFVLEIFKFMSWIFDHVEKRGKKRLNSEFLTSQVGKQTIIIHIWPNISRSKGKQTMRFGQLTQCKR